MSLSTIISSCPNIRNLAIHLPLSINEGRYVELTDLLRVPVLVSGIPYLTHLTGIEEHRNL